MAVLFIVSEAWLASKWCADEYHLANKFNKKLFALLVDDIALDRLPGGLAAQWQMARLRGEPAERFVTAHLFVLSPHDLRRQACKLLAGLTPTYARRNAACRLSGQHAQRAAAGSIGRLLVWRACRQTFMACQTDELVSDAEITSRLPLWNPPPRLRVT
jgi:hypothetical protein